MQKWAVDEGIKAQSFNHKVDSHFQRAKAFTNLQMWVQSSCIHIWGFCKGLGLSVVKGCRSSIVV
ncbi:4a-hydroxytetrahydrobiopterin dehydratase [Neisseria shayeganii 871]|uniref:4a-hydroxytetrahydrobiopterin dehydratase n=1 Tax=Neisseria shayeganii 871 TaxID=1032488 RepID=G4CHL8_9NEIS|nr:4a-hydroxytetrahydrobiopterin dehydratase [Neisseria shayeganii 871]